MKKLFCLLIVVITLFVSCCCVSAEEIDSGTINSTALNYLSGVVKKLPINTNYFLYRIDNYSAALVYSDDLSLSDNIIIGSDVTRITYNTRSYISSSDYDPTVTTDILSSLELNTSIYSIAYSSLGHWSTVADQGPKLLTYILYSLILLLFLFVAFKFLRNRRSYISL